MAEFKTQSPEAWARQLNFSGIELRHMLPPGILMAVCRAESSGNPNAVGPKTRYGQACGLFQFLDGTAKECGVQDRFDPAQAAEGAAVYLTKHMVEHKGDIAKALACYNWGPGNLQKAVDKYGDDWFRHAPLETRNYVTKIMGEMKGQNALSPLRYVSAPSEDFDTYDARMTKEEAERKAAEGKDQDWLKQIGSMFSDAGSMIVGAFMMIFAAFTGKPSETGTVDASGGTTPPATTPPASAPITEPPPSNPDKAKEDAAKAVNGCDISIGVCVTDSTAQANLPKVDAPWMQPPSFIPR